MSTPVRASDRDLRALAAIVSQDRPDLPDGEGLPPSLLADLMGQIRCDVVSFEGFDSGRQACGSGRKSRPPTTPSVEGQDRGTGALLGVQTLQLSGPHRRPAQHLKVADFYSARQWHTTGMYNDFYRPLGMEHELMLCLPRRRGKPRARACAAVLRRGPGPDFSERDRALLTLLRPHLHQAYLDAERRRHPVPRLTPRQTGLLRLVAAGHTNTQIARRLGISEGTVRTHLENIYGRLHVSSRTAAVTRAFPGQAA